MSSSRIRASLSRAKRIREISASLSTLEKKAKVLRAERELLQTEIIVFMKKEKLEKIADTQWSYSIKSTDVPTIKNFETFWNYVRKNNAPELMNRTCNSKAWRERDQDVPGIEPFTKESLSITKRK